MRILVTGGAGFVGTNLIKQLLENEHEVVSVDDYSTGKKSNHIKGCQYLERDILDIHHTNFVYDVDVVFHLAAKARIQPSFEQPLEYIRVNYEGTLNLIHLCINRNIPLIYAGSSSHHSGKFKNPYTFSKDMGEEIIQLYQKHFGLKSSIARFYNVYGPYQLTEGGYTTLIGRWINNIKNGLPCEIYGDGSKRRDFTHVEDIVKGLISIMDQNTYGHIFEFGRGKNHSVLDVANMFGIKPTYKKNKPGEAQETLADYSLAKEILGWVPEIDLQYYINTIKNG
jgi:UDP-glucose 4-epimerase